MASRDVPKRIGERWDIEKKLGEGSFGEVYKGIDGRTGDFVAIKFEEFNSSAPGSLKNEFRLLEELRRPSASGRIQRHGFAEAFFFSKVGRWSVLVMELLGCSLEDCVEKCGGKFKIPTTVLIAEQVLQRLEFLHSKGIVHRDIKPENFMMGLGHKVHHMYLIDFGLSVRYWDKRHASQSSSQSLTGTARYASINAHRGCTQSRRDDLEAIGHMLLYFLRGSLPWSGLKAKTQEEKFRKIMETKERYSVQELCKQFPKEFEFFLRYTRNLGFKERPDYSMLQKSFRDVRDKEGIVEDWEFEWLDPKRIDTRALCPIDPGCGHVQPDDAFHRGATHCFCWSSNRRAQIREKE
uniref:Casein kinase I n=1 Tax=Zooxanthella nutricula TaxID=1333877 RepID=A0A6U9IL86_9DINO|mmetsp:Transcript_22056/g.65826  ORF Transcript_22056/g.65826 Transcript_22056/m.65826 type:complete len:351 (+) Transcript_22056:108-1160(+)